MASHAQIQRERFRVKLVLAAMQAVLALLVIALWRLQVAQGARYENHLRTQSLRRVRVPATRGRIFDRNGVCLADNRASYCVALNLDQVRQHGKLQSTVTHAMELLRAVGVVIGRPVAISEEDVWKHVRRRLPLPLIAWRDVDPNVMARLAEQGYRLPGMEIVVESSRVYPHGKLAAHLLGYVARASGAVDDEDEAPYHYHLPELEGRRGLELKFNNLLTGAAGSRLVRIDVIGFKRSEILEREAHAGLDLILALDIRIQRLAEQALGDDPGAVVVLDTVVGDVLAMASTPAFDPNAFLPAISHEEWSRLISDPAHPLINRVTGAIYPPGSVFKPIVALAALGGGLVTEHTSFSCPGYFQLGPVKFACWDPNGHGTLAMRKGIEQSCNAYFCALGHRIGYAPIYRCAQAAGYGRKTGIDCDYEVAGILPDDAWKRRVMHEAWRPGDTCNISIGQGALAVTPIQVAVMTAALASDGNIFRPHVVLAAREANGSTLHSMPGAPPQAASWAKADLNIVRNGMRDVIQSPSGTGMRARIADIEMAGKTGTAEYGPRDQRKKHTWMIVFAPFAAPRYAAVMVLDEGETGGKSVAPRMRELMDGIFHGTRETAGGEPGEEADG